MNLREQLEFTNGFEGKNQFEGIEEKVKKSLVILKSLTKDRKILAEITENNLLLGLIPRLSPFDLKCLPSNVKLVEVPSSLRERQKQVRSFDLITWNKPEKFLSRLRLKDKPFVPPKAGDSFTMDRILEQQKIVSFEDLRSETPPPDSIRKSRTRNYQNQENNIMSRMRIPLAFGSVPDVGSIPSYVTMAQSNGLVFVSRDKNFSNIGNQSTLVKMVISCLKEVSLPKELIPNDQQLREFWEIIRKPMRDFNSLTAAQLYEEELRSSWISNIGAAIEASPKGIERAKALHKSGCKMFRIYSPEGGLEIVETASSLRDFNEFKKDSSIKIIAGQIMDSDTAIKAERIGCDAIIIGVAGGSQCTTSVNADIPVNTPNLLYKLRGKLGIPIGIEGGGVGIHMITAFALGASFLCKPGEIGISLEGAGGRFMFQDNNKKFWMLYGGEASDSAKWWRGSTDALGRTLFVEGEIGTRQVVEDKLFMTDNIRELLERIAVGLVFQRVATIADLHARNCSNIVEVSQAAAQLSRAYAQ